MDFGPNRTDRGLLPYLVVDPLILPYRTMFKSLNLYAIVGLID
jgi:hypothetical protein